MDLREPMMGEESTKEIHDLWSVDQLHLAIEIVANGMVVADEYGLIVMTNSRAEEIFGYCRNELLGRPFSLLVSEECRDNPLLDDHYFANPVPKAMGAGCDLVGLRRDGTEIPVEIGLKPLRTEEGQFVLCEIAEITARKQLEARVIRNKKIDAQESERRHLARELHDELGQLLCTISLNLNAVRRTCGSSIPQLDENIQHVHHAIEQIRNFSLDLRPPMLDDIGLIPTLRWYANRQLKNAGIVPHFAAKSSGVHLAPDLATTCYRLVQEALANAIRHSQARQVWIEFYEDQDEVRISVRDDGIGFDPAVAPRRTIGNACCGVLGMKERVHILGGEIGIHSALAQGTTIEIYIPTKSTASLATR